MSMNRKGLFPTYRRLNGVPMKEKEKKCWACGSQSYRVEWEVPWIVGKQICECGLEFQEEIIERELVCIKSSMGEFEDKF